MTLSWCWLLVREFGFFFGRDSGWGFTEKADESSNHDEEGNPENVAEEEAAEYTYDASNDASNDELFVLCPHQAGTSNVDHNGKLYLISLDG